MQHDNYSQNKVVMPCTVVQILILIKVNSKCKVLKCMQLEL